MARDDCDGRRQRRCSGKDIVTFVFSRHFAKTVVGTPKIVSASACCSPVTRSQSGEHAKPAAAAADATEDDDAHDDEPDGAKADAGDDE